MGWLAGFLGWVDARLGERRRSCAAWTTSPEFPGNLGAVALFEGPAPAADELAETLVGKLELLPRYRQRVRFAGGAKTRPLAGKFTHNETAGLVLFALFEEHSCLESFGFVSDRHDFTQP